MSLPWAHPIEPIFKVVPRDLDEMPGIMFIGNECPEEQLHGVFEHLKDEGLPKNTLAASRRSNDPGVVELTMFVRPTHAQRHLAYSPKVYDPRQEDAH